MASKEILIGVATAAILAIGAAALKTWKDVELLKSKIGGTDDVSTKLEKVETTLLSKISNVQSNVDLLETKTVNGSDLDSMNTQLSQLSGKLNSNIDQVTAINSQLTNHNSKLLVLEGMKLEAITMYQCPDNEETNGSAAWASFGCIGQVSHAKSCGNYAWGIGEKKFPCTPITLYRKK